MVVRKQQQGHPLGISILHQQALSTKDKFIVFRWNNTEYLCIVCPGQYCYKVDQRSSKGSASCQDKENFDEILQKEGQFTAPT
jgi:hypothetical protein